MSHMPLIYAHLSIHHAATRRLRQSVPTYLSIREQIAVPHTVLRLSPPAHLLPANIPSPPIPRELKRQQHSGDSHWSPNVHHHQQVGLNSRAGTKARGCCQRPVCVCARARARVCVNFFVLCNYIIICGAQYKSSLFFFIHAHGTRGLLL